MDKHKILMDAKAELERHVWGTFVEGKATVALGVRVWLFRVAKPAARDLERTVNTSGIYPMTCCPLFCRRLSRLPAFPLRNSDHTQRPDFAEFPETAPQRVRGRATIAMNAAGFERTLPVSPCRPLY